MLEMEDFSERHTQKDPCCVEGCCYSRMAVAQHNLIGRLTRFLRATPARNVRSHLLANMV
jgi:hypothetical protein